MNVSQGCDGGCRGPTKMISCVLLIVLLVFGVNVATADNTTTSATKYECQDIPKGMPTENVINDCSAKPIIMSSNAVFDISNLPQEKVNNFFTSITAGFFMDFRMENNNEIVTLDFGKVATFGKNIFVINNNLKLENIKGLASLKFINKDVTIRGNRRLTEESIKYLTIMAGTLEVDIQEANECSQTDPDFTECERIYGDLVLTDFSQQTNPKFKPKAVSGCLKLTKTSVDLNVMEFIKDLNYSKMNCSGTNEITGYCIMEKDLVFLKKQFGQKPLTINNAGSCGYVCEQMDIFEHLQKECKTIRGDIAVTSSWNVTQLDLLKPVETINGSVKIDGVDGSKLGGKLQFFAFLKYINSPNSNVPALTITNNIKASEITLDLKKIESKAKNKLLYEKNSFNCSREQRMMLGTAMDVEVVICGGEKAPSPTPAPPTSGNGNGTGNGTDGQLTETEANQRNGKTEEEGSKTGVLWGSIGGSIGAIIFIVVIIIAIIFIIRCLKKKKKKTNATETSVDVEKTNKSKSVQQSVAEGAKSDQVDLNLKKASKNDTKLAKKFEAMIDAILNLKYTLPPYVVSEKKVKMEDMKEAKEKGKDDHGNEEKDKKEDKAKEKDGSDEEDKDKEKDKEKNKEKNKKDDKKEDKKGTKEKGGSDKEDKDKEKDKEKDQKDAKVKEDNKENEVEGKGKEAKEKDGKENGKAAEKKEPKVYTINDVERFFLENAYKPYYMGKDLEKEDGAKVGDIDVELYAKERVIIDNKKYGLPELPVLHANNVQLKDHPRKFIASAFPMRSDKTLDPFLAMLHQEKVPAVVVLQPCVYYDNAPAYYPVNEGDFRETERFLMETTKCETLPGNFLERREMKVAFKKGDTVEEWDKRLQKEQDEDDEERAAYHPIMMAHREEATLANKRYVEDPERTKYLKELHKKKVIVRKEMMKKYAEHTFTFVHFQLLNWRDRTASPELYCSFTCLYEQLEKLNLKETDKTVVHCKAGVGRTGTFITAMKIMYILNKVLPNSATTPEMNFFEMFEDIRRQRYWAIQMCEQFECLPAIALMYCKAHVVDERVAKKCDPIIDNFKRNAKPVPQANYGTATPDHAKGYFRKEYGHY